MSEANKEVIVRSMWKEFKDIFLVAALLFAIFAGAVMLLEYKMQTTNRYGKWFEMCLRDERVIDNKTASICGQIAVIMYENAKYENSKK